MMTKNIVSYEEHIIEDLAALLFTKPRIIGKFFELLKKATGKKNLETKVADNIFGKAAQIRQALGYGPGISAKEMYKIILIHIKQIDQKLFEMLQKPVCMDVAGCTKLLNSVNALHPAPRGFFLKEKKARELIEKTPPKTIISALGFRSVRELLDSEDIFNIYAALRFVESRTWMNKRFLPQYKNLKPSDFEERPVQFRILERSKWFGKAKAFVEKKYHDVSHLKELGLIFEVPLEYRGPGLTLRLFSLILHYHSELDFYSDYFRFLVKRNPSNFAKGLIYALRGENRTPTKIKNGKEAIFIIQRYLAKENVAHPMLKIPHVSPEVAHWYVAEDALSRLGKIDPSLGLEIWDNSDAAGAFFPLGAKEALVSFNLIDNVINLANDRSFAKRAYYHLQEAAWKEILRSVIGERKLKRLLIENLYRGFITAKELK